VRAAKTVCRAPHALAIALVCGCLPAPAQALESVRLIATLTPERLGHARVGRTSPGAEGFERGCRAGG
jgi:hypothetical protein